jgi:protein phosphatase
MSTLASVELHASLEAILGFYSIYFEVPPSEFEKEQFKLTLPVIPLPVLKSLCDVVRKTFSSEPMLLHFTEPVVIVGDLHGHLLDLLRTLRVIGPPPVRTYLFLGDLVDRGEFSTETFELIFILKAMFPRNVYCIRGNHEFAQMIEHGGFSEELLTIYHTPEAEPWVLDAFAWMPIAAVIGGAVLCVHGGIGPELQTLSQLAEVQRPLLDYDTALVQGLLWSDPSPAIDTFQPNSRGIGYLYGSASLANFLATQGLKYLVRGHECVENGVEVQLERRLFTVFGASTYSGQGTNKAGIMIVRPDASKEIVVFPPIPYMNRCAASFVQSECQNAFVSRRGGEGRRSLPPRPLAPIEKAGSGMRNPGRQSDPVGRLGEQRAKLGGPKLRTPAIGKGKGIAFSSQKR